jgi:predicted metal-dependent hydrolase
MRTVTVNNIQVEVEWKKIKNIHLTIYPPGARVHVSAPRQMTEEAVRLFVISKLTWINKRIEILQNQPRQTPREYVSGENHYFKGCRYRLNVIEQEAPPKVELHGNQHINLYVRSGATLEKKEEVMREWYREELKLILAPLVSKWETLLGVKTSHWEVTKMKTLWGSCNIRTKRLNFNLELAKKPLHCIEYIVAHEAAHLLVRLHNKRFAALLDTYMPNWRQLQKELNDFIV